MAVLSLFIRDIFDDVITTAGLAQSVERQALNLMVEGSSPSFGDFLSGLSFFMRNPHTIQNESPGLSFFCGIPT